MSLSSKTCKFIEKQKLFTREDQLLLAVSGGMDSMVMMDLLRTAGYGLIVAHVNYKLRGDASHQDEYLVTTYCSEYHIPYEIYQVTAEESDLLAQGNLQATARDIRYTFFHSLLERYELTYVCTAHHQQDQVETFFLHLMRGSGLTGLSAMQAASGLIRRPLLSCSQVEIEDYASTHQVPFRHDVSNESDSYDRNYIRHHILPAVTERWPQGEDRILTSIAHITDSNALVLDHITLLRERWICTKADQIKIGPISEIARLAGAKTILHHLLTDYGVTTDSIDLLLSGNISTGANIDSGRYHIVMDRDHLLIDQSKQRQMSAMEIASDGTFVNDLGQQLHIIPTTNRTFDASPYIEIMDTSRVSLPLVWRTWVHGDRIRPMGMKGASKLISDLLIDAKVDVHSKASSQILQDAHGEIIWAIGLRLSEIVKVDSHSTNFIKLTYAPSTAISQ